MVGLIQFLPVLSLVLISGYVADHYDRRKIMVISLCADLVSTLTLAFLAFTHPMLWPIFAIAAAFGFSRAFIAPAGGALAPMLVPKELMPRALAWNSLSWQTATIIGPIIGGCVLAALYHETEPSSANNAAGWAYVCSATIYVLAITCMTLIRGKTRPDRQAGSRWEMMKEGMAYVASQKIVLGAISLDLFAVLLGGATALLPVFAADVLPLDSSQRAMAYGLLRAMPGTGATIVALYLAGRPVKRRAGRAIFIGVAIFGAATVVFGVSRSLPLSMVALAVLGGADMLSVYVRQTLVQIVTPDAMRGRVAAVSSLFIGASNELGEFESGVAARFLGPVGAAVFGGVGALIVTGAWARMFPDLRKADKLTGD